MPISKIKKNNKITYQQSLDKWFQRKDTEGNQIEATYSIFYLNWEDENRNAEWLPDFKKNSDSPILYQTQIKCPEISRQNLIHLIGTNRDLEKDRFSEETEFFQEGYYTNIAFLKSHLQKAIRRSQPTLALKTACHFIKLDIGQFLRRLSIIMLEDCHLMESFTILVWLMAAQSKGYALTKSQVYWLFGIVYNLAVCSNQDTYIHKHSHMNENNQINKNGQHFSIKKANLSKLNNIEKSLLYSLQFRKSFGGLTGDKKLLQSATEIWYKRFLEKNKNKDINENSDFEDKNINENANFEDNNENKNKNNIWIDYLYSYPVHFLSPPEEALRLNEWILPAIDFHCMPNILSILMDKYEEFEYNDLKSTIWNFSSCYNNKKMEKQDFEEIDKHLEELAKIWVIIRPQFYGLAQFFLKNNY